MRINHNIASLNTYRMLNINSTNGNKALEKLSSGLKINRAGDDAAGLAISEKMRAQIRGLDRAAANAQDGISLIQTAEGGLTEVHSILQRMRELATQAANDTNVGVDRTEIQKELNQLSSEINRIGNTTEFNTQSLLKGDGKADLVKTNLVADGVLGFNTAAGDVAGATNYSQASQATTFGLLDNAADTGKTATWTINGQQLTINFVADTGLGAGTAQLDAATVTGNTATIKYNASAAAATGDAVNAALTEVIKQNSTLAWNYAVTDNNAGQVTVAAVAGQDFDGAAGNIAAISSSAPFNVALVGGAASVGTTTYTQATKVTAFAGLETGTAATTNANIEALVGTGLTVNGTQIEFYDATEGAYTGSGIGVAINTALETAVDASKADALVKAIADTVGSKIDGVILSQDTVTADKLVITASSAYLGEAGNALKVEDGGVQTAYQATFQVGANKNQSMAIDINDMRANALGLTGTAGSAGFTTANSVTDGTSSVLKEAALDVSSHTSADQAIQVINNAIEQVSAERSKLGAFQNRLEHTINNLGTSSENQTAAESRIRDVDMAKEMMEFTKNNILSQAAQAMLAQANQQPQGVLQLLR